MRVEVKIDIKDSMTIEHRPHPQKEPSLITGSIHEVDGKIIDWVKYPYFQEHNGYKECPLTLKQIENALKWAWIMQDKYHGTARIILNWFGEMTPEAMEKLKPYPEVSPLFDYVKNPEMDGTEEANRRKLEMSRKWKQGRRNGMLKG